MSEIYKIIIADDEEKIREGLANLFPWKQLGFEISATLSNGQEVLDYLQSHLDIDVLLTDIKMPVVDGIRLSSILKSGDIKLVFISSYTDFSYAKTALENQVFDYLVKPVKYEDLLSCFKRLRSTLDRNHSNAAVVSMPSRSDTKAIISHVIKYIRSSYADCSLVEAANLVFLTPSYLSTLFSRETGMTFSSYLQKIRMENACRLLSDPTIHQYEVAARIGYDNPKNFTRAFKAYFGETPQDYRKKHSGDSVE